MLIPLGTNNFDQQRFPYVSTALIAINVFVYMLLQSLGDNYQVTLGYSLVPQELFTGQDVVIPERVISFASGASIRFPGPQETPIPVYLTLLTSLFLHGGIFHLLFNMLFLFAFGSSVENELGHKKFLGFYLGAGVLASIAQLLLVVFTRQDPTIPMLGASGAISGIMGAFIVLCPRQTVKVVLFLFFYSTTFYWPAWAFLGVWFFLQLMDGYFSLAMSSSVAHGAHIGGFVVGAVYAKFLFTKDDDEVDHRIIEEGARVSTLNIINLPKKESSQSGGLGSQTLRLRCEEGLLVGESYLLQHRRTIIGRADPAAGIVVDIDLTPQEDGVTPRSVSRQHIEIEQSAGGYLVRDKGSHNGTELNGVRLAADKLRPLKAGDRLHIGAVTLVAENADAI